MANSSWVIIHAVTPPLSEDQEQRIRRGEQFHVLQDPGSIPIPTGTAETSNASRTPFNFRPDELTVESLTASRNFVLTVTDSVRFETDSDDPHVQAVVHAVNSLQG